MTRLAHACKIRNTYPDFHPDYLIVVVLVVVLGLLVVNKSTTRTSTTTMRGI
jgi:hypothetical protein